MVAVTGLCACVCVCVRVWSHALSGQAHLSRALSLSPSLSPSVFCFVSHGSSPVDIR